MEFKYAGSLQLESYNRNTNLQIRGKRRRSECLMEFFVVTVPYTETLFII
jgi:hypothetical protein